MANPSDTHFFRIRKAIEDDTALILNFIRELAEYEKLTFMVNATEDNLRQSLFHDNRAEVLIAEYHNKPVGFALYFYNYSTFRGQPGMYLEDLYLKPEARLKGFGRLMLAHLAQLAIEKNCGRLEWACLDWNEPAIGFYKKLGAQPQNEWTVYRLEGYTLSELAAAAPNNG